MVQLQVTVKKPHTKTAHTETPHGFITFFLNFATRPIGASDQQQSAPRLAKGTASHRVERAGGERYAFIGMKNDIIVGR